MSKQLHQQFRTVDIKLVNPDPDQPRKTFDQEEIKGLAETVRNRGVLNPIRVRVDPHNKDRFIIIGGERRWRATVLAEQPTIDCLIVEGTMTPREILEEQLLDNMHRSDLNPIEQALGFKKYMDMSSWNGRQLADHLHLNRQTVINNLSLLNLAIDVQELVSSGKLAQQAAYELAKLTDTAQQRQIASQVVEQNLPASKVAALVRRATRTKRASRSSTRTQINVSHGTRVVIISKRKLDAAGVLDTLAQALQEAQEDVAASAEGKSSEPITPTVIRKLMEVFTDKDLTPNFLAAVDEVFARIGPALVLELYQLLSHDDREVRNEATRPFSSLSPDVLRAIDHLKPRKGTRKEKGA